MAGFDQLVPVTTPEQVQSLPAVDLLVVLDVDVGSRLCHVKDVKRSTTIIVDHHRSSDPSSADLAALIAAWPAPG